MCKYCEKFSDNDTNDTLLSVGLRMNKVYIMGAQVFITEEYGEHCLSLYIHTPSSSRISEKLISISYCPKCGRKLKE